MTLYSCPNKKTLIAWLLLAVTTIIVFWPVLGSRFVIYDDPEYITENAPVLAGLTGDSLIWAFTSSHTGNWHPLTWLSHMLDATLYGLEPRGHHLTSLLFHTANTLLLFTLLGRMTGLFWRSLAVACLFALHPLHVESVAWVAERKDVLSGFFFMLTLLAYHRYTLRPGPWRYVAVALLFVCGLMAKQMLVTLPLLVLLLDWWPLGRLRKEVAPRESGRMFLGRPVWEKLPLFAIAALGAILTFVTHWREDTVSSVAPVALLQNAANALVATAWYLYKMVLPSELAVFYPYTPGFPPAVEVTGAAFLVIGTTIVALLLRKRAPYLAVGWFWYLITLLPVSGLVRIGSMSMADRYTYLPLIGPFIALAWGVGELAEKRRRTRPILTTSAVLLFVLLGTLTFRQVRHWHDSITLFSHAVAVTRNNWLAYNNLGVSYVLQGDPNTRLNIVRSLRDPGDAFSALEPRAAEELSLRRARGAFLEAVRIRPQYESARYNLGLACLKLGDRDAAIAEYRSLLGLDLRLATDLGKALER